MVSTTSLRGMRARGRYSMTDLHAFRLAPVRAAVVTALATLAQPTQVLAQDADALGRYWFAGATVKF